MDEAHYATIWEGIADRCPIAPAVIEGSQILDWGTFEARSARLAGVMQDAGLQAESKVATYLFNCPELLESRFAALKQRCVPLNVNYRYLAEEVFYVLDNSDAQALIFHRSLAAHVRPIQDRLPKVRLWIEVNDHGEAQAAALDYEACIAQATPASRQRRSADDIQLIYTGGTTGKPKGVMIRIGNAVPAGLGLAASVGLPLVTPDAAIQTATQLIQGGLQARSMVPCPLIHGTGLQLGANPFLTLGGCVVLAPSRRFDPVEVWSEIERHQVTHLTLVGEPMARPLAGALRQGETAQGESLRYIASSGAMLSQETKQDLVNKLPNLTIFDLMSSTEGSLGKSFYTRSTRPETSTFVLNPSARVFDDNDIEIEPGSTRIGRIAVTGAIPLGYYKDPEKTAATFRSINGSIWSFPGDYARVDASGAIHLLGRGSSVINSGGEKVFAEEVEEAVKRVPGVNDCLVIGIPDERLGQQVCALVSPKSAPNPPHIREVLRGMLAAYKLPRTFVLVDDMPRGPNGKADYVEAKRLALSV
jgi:acyl-CoA synthetase (AMP-forming)/AMP-acid ligase II